MVISMTQQNEITNLVREADDQKTPETLFQYTSLGVLALILKNRTIRFNSLANLDDLEESQMIFYGKNPPITYVSCWTEISNEEIFMWKLYTKLSDGVRIELPVGSFVDPQQNGDDRIKNGSYDYDHACWLPKLPQTKDDPEIVSMIQPRSCNYPSKVIYSDDFPASTIIASEAVDKNSSAIHGDCIARFKRKTWAFQEEYRYIITLFRPGEYVPLRDYYDVNLTENAIHNMKVVTSPMFDPGNYILLEALLKEYAGGKGFTRSSLEGQIRLK